MRVILLLLISCSLLLHGTEAISFALRSDWSLYGVWRNETTGRFCNFHHYFYSTNIYASTEINNITIPSGVFSDLENANITESILFSYNDVALRDIAMVNWTYSKKFNMTTEDLDHNNLILTLHGLDTISEIFLNEHLLGTTDNMFLRYRYDITDILVDGENNLSINFESPVKAAENLNELLEYPVPPSCPPKNYNGNFFIITLVIFLNRSNFTITR